MAKANSTEAALNAAQKAGSDAAAAWDSDSGIDSSIHRLRSLMNFERDVVKSTGDDGHAIVQWQAFLTAYDKRCPGHCIYMDDQRAMRFHSVLCSLCNVLSSLEGMVSKFPRHSGLSDGEIDPEIAVVGMLQTVSPMTSLMLAMVINEEAGCEYPGLLSKLKKSV